MASYPSIFIFPTLRKQIRAWLKAGVMDGLEFKPTSQGTPRGTISPLLANIALHGMENVIKRLAESLDLKRANGKHQLSKKDKRRSVSLIRYADDFVIFHIGMARAFMTDAPILILDEPTAALDAIAEYELFEKFGALTAGKMTFFVSHRFSTVQLADRIVVLQNSHIVEVGSHQELMARDGLYAQMFRLQASSYNL